MWPIVFEADVCEGPITRPELPQQLALVSLWALRNIACSERRFRSFRGRADRHRQRPAAHGGVGRVHKKLDRKRCRKLSLHYYPISTLLFRLHVLLSYLSCSPPPCSPHSTPISQLSSTTEEKTSDHGHSSPLILGFGLGLHGRRLRTCGRGHRAAMVIAPLLVRHLVLVTALLVHTMVDVVVIAELFGRRDVVLLEAGAPALREARRHRSGGAGARDRRGLRFLSLGFGRGSLYLLR